VIPPLPLNQKQDGERWKAQIQIKSQLHHLGYYTSELAAARMFDRVLIQQGLVGQPQRRLNFDEAEYAGDPLLAELRGLSIKEVRKRCQREAERERSGEIAPLTDQE